MKPNYRVQPSSGLGTSGIDLGAAAFAALVVILATVLVVRTLAPMRDDVAWLLYVAQAWLDGQEPYGTLAEVNPPPVIWLSMLPVLLARALGTSVLLVAPAFFAACVLGCAWLFSGILQRQGSPWDRLTVFSVVGAVLLLMPITEFGQREHLIAAGALPYLALRTGTLRPTSADAVLAGLLAGFCCSVKLHYALPFLAVEALAIRRGTRPSWRAIAATMATGLLCLGAALLLTPEYFRSMLPLARDLYLPTLHGDLLDRTTAPLILCWAVALLLWLTHRGRLADGGITGILLAFSTGAMLVYASQGKGWLYQVLPAGITAVLALLAWLFTVRPAPGWRRAAVPLAVVALLVDGGKTAQHLRRTAGFALAPEATVEMRLADRIRREGVSSYLAFATTLKRGFPVVQAAEVAWASRFPSTWALAAEQHRREAGVRPVAGEPVVAGWMARDFLAACPGLVAVEDGGPVDAVALLAGADPAFARAWAQYQPLTRIEGLQLFRRPENQAICR